jgi:integrase
VRQPRKLPLVLSAAEVALLLEAAPGPKYKAALATAYGAGLRVAEVVSLRVGDVDSTRMMLRVEQARAAGIAMRCSRPSCSRCCAPTPHSIFPGGFRTPALGAARSVTAGRHPKPFTRPAGRSLAMAGPLFGLKQTR